MKRPAELWDLKDIGRCKIHNVRWVLVDDGTYVPYVIRAEDFDRPVEAGGSLVAYDHWCRNVDKRTITGIAGRVLVAVVFGKLAKCGKDD